MADRGYRYALSALMRKRGSLASEIIQAQRKLRHLKEAIGNVDATLRLLDPSISTDDIPNKRPTKRVKLFRHGELNRLVRDALRDAGKPVSCQEIVSRLMKAGGYGEESRPAIRSRVRGNLAYLERNGEVRKSGEQRHCVAKAPSPKSRGLE
jgi:hypothetical protein